jgi:hypothetical protein
LALADPHLDGTLAVGHDVLTDAAEEREHRQLHLIEDRLSQFDRGEVDLGPIIADLRDLLAAIAPTPDAWKERFTEEWGQLEIAYALALDHKEPVPDATNPLLGQASRNMMELVEARLG